MTKRKPRRKAPQKAGRPIGWIWWTVGVLAIGWIAFDANRTSLLAYAPTLASLTGEPQEKSAPTRPRAETHTRIEPRAETRTRMGPREIAEPKAAPARPVPTPPARLATLARPPAPAGAVPTVRPDAAVPVHSAERVSGTVTRRPTPLRRSPSAEAPVWATIDAGRSVRVTARKGTWRRVESGIFTGWVDAAFVETEAPSGAIPLRPVLAATKRIQPVPPATVPQPGR